MISPFRTNSRLVTSTVLSARSKDASERDVSVGVVAIDLEASPPTYVESVPPPVSGNKSRNVVVKSHS
ncbi:hypothetical protein EXIGLDRAFT_731512 [Exidia glandulosa HHB12029]|uniref:Uncharacterized protein n=1 Tax=Exidia glandulosa HHB12029 TaxID=1314781 RepID=A0A165BUT2_EXIGL|nr:hypothetical protein EXIGLDRAFT_731512 [Exidia glandulosa HHB12029]